MTHGERTKKPHKVAAVASGPRLHFNIGGTKYGVSPSVIDKFPDSKMAKICSDTWNNSSPCRGPDESRIPGRFVSRIIFQCVFLSDCRSSPSSRDYLRVVGSTSSWTWMRFGLHRTFLPSLDKWRPGDHVKKLCLAISSMVLIHLLLEFSALHLVRRLIGPSVVLSFLFLFASTIWIISKSRLCGT
jgi:hypothetical protein